jgi:hypothetical protein
VRQLDPSDAGLATDTASTPSEEVDAEVAPLALKTVEFYDTNAQLDHAGVLRK